MVPWPGVKEDRFDYDPRVRDKEMHDEKQPASAVRPAQSKRASNPERIYNRTSRTGMADRSVLSRASSRDTEFYRVFTAQLSVAHFARLASLWLAEKNSAEKILILSHPARAGYVEFKGPARNVLVKDIELALTSLVEGMDNWTIDAAPLLLPA